MDRYFKMLLSLLLASATALFICGVTAGQAFAAFQDEAEEEVGYTEEEYAAWDAADKESDILKSSEMLIEFMQKNPDSDLVPYAEGSYMRLLARCVEEKKYQELEPLAERWNAFKPGDDNILRMIALSARELKHTEKYLTVIEDLYKRDPQLNLAREIAALYKVEMKNDDKYIEWTLVIMKAPEEASNFLMHYELFSYYQGKKDDAKTMEYAQSTLKAIDGATSPSAEEKKIIPEIRYALNHYIGASRYTDKKYDDAMTYLLKALRDKKYANGYFLIGNCLWEQKKVLNAMYAFAKAQQLGETAQATTEDKSIAPKAKDRMEQLYKAMQNNTLVGIDRRYKRAQEMSDEDLIKPME